MPTEASAAVVRIHCHCPLACHQTPCESLHACALLESLDDAMFAAMGGDEQALDEARRFWQDACAALSAELLDESREQYLRYAAEVIQEFGCDQVRRPQQMLAAIEVIQMLTSNSARFC